MPSKTRKRHHAVPLSFYRKAVRASASVSRQKNTIHSLLEVDVSRPRQWLREHAGKTGEKLSFTAYIVSCLARVIESYPIMNSFIKGNKQVFLHDVTVSVLIERELEGEKVPEPLGIQKTQDKTFREIHQEIRAAQQQGGKDLGSLSGISWFRLVPGCLLRTFVRLADKNIRLAKRYGKVAVTAMGMYSKGATWFIPHGTATVLVTVGRISNKPVMTEHGMVTKEHLSLTISFDHDLVDGAPAARFLRDFTNEIEEGRMLTESRPNTR